VAAADGLFEAIGKRLANTRLGPLGLLLALLTLVALVTALLNLDTAVVFLTPVLVHAARRRALDERPFLYGSVFMANAGSLLLPGSNLTNLLVLRGDPQAGAAFARQMLPAWIVPCAITGAFLSIVFRLRAGEQDDSCDVPPIRLGLSATAMLAAAALIVALPNAALPILAVGLVTTFVRGLRPRLDGPTLASLFVLAVGLGVVGRLWGTPAHLIDSSGTWGAAGIGALGSVLVNNLPAAVLLTAHPDPRAQSLLLGLNLGPNLAVTGSLSAVLWLRAAHAVDAQPSIATYSRLGVLLVPLTLGATLIALLVAH
jgi:arsenical pump membrane protein